MGDLHGIWQTSGKIVPCYSFIETIVVEVTMHSRRKIKCYLDKRALQTGIHTINKEIVIGKL